jgi:hypothetical protein
MYCHISSMTYQKPSLLFLHLQQRSLLGTVQAEASHAKCGLLQTIVTGMAYFLLIAEAADNGTDTGVGVACVTSIDGVYSETDLN